MGSDRELNCSQTPYLGPTAYSVYSVGSLFHNEPAEDELFQNQKIREGRAEEGVKMLASLQDFPLYELPVPKWHDDIHGATTFCPWIMACFASVRTELYESFNGQAVDRQAIVLVELSKKPFHSGLRLLKVDGTGTLDQYLLSFNGPNIKWATVGMFFTTAGLAKMKKSATGARTAPGLGWTHRTLRPGSTDD